MVSSVRVIVSMAAVLVGSPKLAAEGMSDAAAFGTRDAVESIALSPSGRRMVMVNAGAGRESVVHVVDIATGAMKSVMRSTGTPEALKWCDFASEDELVCRYGGQLAEGREIYGFGRLIAFDVNGQNIKMLGQRTSLYDRGMRQFDGSILDWLPDNPGAVLMARAYVPESGIDRSTRLASDLDGLGVDRITLPSMAVSPVEKPGPAVVGYLSDGHGHVRIMQTADVDEYGAKKSERYQYSYRKKESRTWQRLGQYDAIARTGIIPLAIDSTIDSLYLLKSLDGRDALYSMKLDGSGTETLVASNKNVDIDDVVQVGHGQAVIGYTFADDRRHTVYFDPEFEKLATALGRVLPNQPIVNFVSASGDGSKLIIFGGSATNPGIYYFYDRASKHLNELVLARPDLEHHALGNVQAINYPAADGVSIPAYLTLPPGGAAGNLPAVVLPHGGPSARDEWGFDWLAQFLASRGYAVIQPNFRGSAGYGDAWLSQNGFKGWRTSISDISASARYLAAKGIADPKRIAILGWSYGGYAALQSAATEPALYRAAVAIAPVTDLSLLKADARDFSNSKLINDLTGSGEQVVSGSPLRKARLIRIPVLMFHGDRDGNVTIAHSERMAAALTNGSSSVELIRFPGLDHQLQDTDARRKMLQKIDDFLLRELAR